MSLFGALQQIVDTANTHPATGDSHVMQNDANYHRRIVLVGSCCAAVGAALGLLTSFIVAGDAETGREIKGVLMAPVLYGAGGFIFGMAIMCLFAPRSFLTGPDGAAWMKLIGTENVLVARIVCLLFGLLVTIPLLGIGLLIAMGS